MTHKRRKPQPQIEISIPHPRPVLRELRKKGWMGYAKKNGNLWLRGTEEMVKKTLPGCKVVKVVGE